MSSTSFGDFMTTGGFNQKTSNVDIFIRANHVYPRWNWLEKTTHRDPRHMRTTCQPLLVTSVLHHLCQVPAKQGTPFSPQNYPPRQNNGPQPITAGLGLTLPETKAEGQAPEPPSAPPLRPTSLCLARPSWRHPGARLLLRSTPTVTHYYEYARAPTLSC
jgi:hypothetical protein